MHRTQGDTSRAPRSAAEPQRDVWRGRVRTHLACPTPDEEGFRVADRSGPAATPARTRNKESRRSAGEMKMFRGQQYRCAYLTSEAIERFCMPWLQTTTASNTAAGAAGARTLWQLDHERPGARHPPPRRARVLKDLRGLTLYETSEPTAPAVQAHLLACS